MTSAADSASTAPRDDDGKLVVAISARALFDLSESHELFENEGLDAAARDFVAGMTDRYAVSLYEQLFIPKPWA